MTGIDFYLAALAIYILFVQALLSLKAVLPEGGRGAGAVGGQRGWSESAVFMVANGCW